MKRHSKLLTKSAKKLTIILLAVLAVIPMGLSAEGKALYLSDKINISEIFSLGKIGGLVFFAIILFTIYGFATKNSKNK